MSPDAAVAALDERTALDFLARMIRFRSYPDTPGETELARFMAAAMEALGLEVELQHVSGERYNAIGRLPGTGGGASLLFNGHLDTNPASEGWTVDPWGGVIDDRFVYGIGVSNMKAGDAAYFSAVKTLVDAGMRPPGDIVLTYVVGELQGGVGTVRAIEAGTQADYFVNAEPTDLNGLTLHAGSVEFVIELTGVTRHISKREEAVDVILAASRLVPEIDAMTFSGAANAAHLGINRANIGTLRAALSPKFHDWRPPQVADFCRMSGSARYAPSQSEESVLADIGDRLEELEHAFPGLQARVCKAPAAERPYSMPPFEVAPDSPIVTAMADAYERTRGRRFTTGAVRPYCFYGTDAAHLLHRAGMPGIVCGPGGKYNTMADERVDIADYLDMVRIYIRTILDICARPSRARNGAAADHPRGRFASRRP